MKRFILIIICLLFAIASFSQAYRPARILTLNSGGGTINIDISKYVENWIIEGTATITSGWTIQPSGTPLTGTEVKFYYTADITYSGGNEIIIFGKTLSQAEAVNDAIIKCIYNGSGWDVILTDETLDQIRITGDTLIAGTDTLVIQGVTSWRSSGNYVRLQNLTDSVAIGKSYAGYHFDLQGNMQVDHVDTTNYFGVLYRNGYPWMHDFSPNGTTGDNVFIGFRAGNFTMRGTSNQCSWNLGLGNDALSSLTNGRDNIALGDYAMHGVTTAIDNVAVGPGAMQDADSAFHCIGIGQFARSNDINAIYTIDIGYEAGNQSDSSYANVNIGARAARAYNGKRSVILGGFAHASTGLYSGAGNDWLLLGYGTSVGSSVWDTDSLINVDGWMYNYNSTSRINLTLNSLTSDTVDIADDLNVLGTMRATDTVMGSDGELVHTFTCTGVDTITSAATWPITNYTNFVFSGDVPADSIEVNAKIPNFAVIYIEIINAGATGGFVDGKNLRLAGDFVGASDNSMIVLQRRGDYYVELSRSTN